MEISDKAVETLREMRQASEAVDEASGTGNYKVALVSLALLAREFLRRVPEDAPAPALSDAEKTAALLGMTRPRYEK